MDPLNISAVPHYKAMNMQCLAKYIVNFKFKSVSTNKKLMHKNSNTPRVLQPVGFVFLPNLRQVVKSRV